MIWTRGIFPSVLYVLSMALIVPKGFGYAIIIQARLNQGSIIPSLTTRYLSFRQWLDIQSWKVSSISVIPPSFLLIYVFYLTFIHPSWSHLNISILWAYSIYRTRSVLEPNARPWGQNIWCLNRWESVSCSILSLLYFIYHLVIFYCGKMRSNISLTFLKSFPSIATWYHALYAWFRTYIF